MPKRKPAAKKVKNGDNNGKTRQRILEAAEKLFIEHGYDGVSVNDVAVEADANKALVFYYFNNKQELFDTVLDGYYQAQAQALLGAMQSTGTQRERVHASLDAYLDFVERHPMYPKLIQREICSSDRNLEKIIQYMKPLESWGMAIFSGRLPQEGPMSARQLFISFFGMVINYYTYAPVLERLWSRAPLGEPALAERRRHLHMMLDDMLDNLLPGE